MTKLLVCIDGSGYADNICTHAAWVAKRLDAEIDLLHVLPRHSDYQAPGKDHTGAIGLGARSNLLETLAKVDEDRARLDQEKGRLILEHGEEILRAAGAKSINRLHRRGSFVETLRELEDGAAMIFVGKRGEHAEDEPGRLGAHLERTVRAVHKPLFVVSSVVRPMKRFLIAYDGKENVRKAVAFLAERGLAKDMECHIMTVGQEGAVDTAQSQKKLADAGYQVTLTHETHDEPEVPIAAYVKAQEIDLVVAGAYSHSRIRNFLLGSTTADLIKTCKVPFMLFR